MAELGVGRPDRRGRTAWLDHTMRLEHWDATTDATFDHKLWDRLCSLRFVEAANNVLIMGPVGVGKDDPRDRPRPHRRAPPPQRPLRTRRPTPQAPPDREARQQATTPSSASSSESTC